MTKSAKSIITRKVGSLLDVRSNPLVEKNGVPILGTTPDAIDRAEDRERFDALLETLALKRPPSGIARSLAEARAVADRIGYPVLVRTSYVLGGRAMEIGPRALASASLHGAHDR